MADMKTEALEDGRSVRVRGSMFHFLKDESKPYTVKLEGAEIVGYRAHTMGSFKDRKCYLQVLLQLFEACLTSE